MTSRPWLLRDLVIVTAAALVARLVAAWIVDWPPYTDPAYYSLVAQRLATGHGFTVPVLWSFLEVGAQLPREPTLPVPSNGHWMPLTSIVAAGSMALLGPSWRAGQLPIVLLATALVPATYLVGVWLWHSRPVGWAAAVLAIFAGPLLLMYSTIDNFAVFGAAGAGAIAAAIRAVESERPGRWLMVSGALVGLATLARIDGVLIALATATAWWLVGTERMGSARRLLSPAQVGIGVAAFLAFAAVLAPWLARNLATFGTPLPSTGGHTLWISSYNEQFSIGHEVSLATYLESGLGTIIGSRVVALFELTARTLALMGGIFAAFFVAGCWIMRRDRRLRPFLVYFWTMFAVMVLVFTFHAPKGAFYHSAPAWLPFALPLSVAAVGPIASRGGRVWPFLARPATHRFLIVAGLVGAVLLSVVGSAVLYEQWADSRARDERAAAFLRANADPRDVIMSSDPASIYPLSGNPGVAAPFDPYPVIGDVIDAYDVRWVLVTRPGPGETDPLGLWDGAAARDIDGNAATFLPDHPAHESGDLRIFRVVD